MPPIMIISFAELMRMRGVEQMAVGVRRGCIMDIRHSSVCAIIDPPDCSVSEADHLPLADTVFDFSSDLRDGLQLVRVQAAARGIALRLAPSVNVQR